MSDPDVWLIKVETDPATGVPVGEPTFAEMTRHDAKGLVAGFVGGGSQLTPINGGVRVMVPNGYWDIVLMESLDFAYRWKGATSG